MITLFLVIIAIVSYALGSVNGAIISSKYIFRKDIREFGSKNAGLTNFYRTFGGAGIALVIGTDVLKSVLAVLVGGWLLGIEGYPFIGQMFAGFCLILGHMFPVFYGFRGGKGILCTGVLLLIADWRIGLLAWTVFIIVLVFTRYVSLASISGTVAALLGFILMHRGIPLVLFLLIALLIIGKHKDNIIRLINGKESKLKIGREKGPTP
jgi:glycerol-3-phosphate acyltransferase PlsY